MLPSILNGLTVLSQYKRKSAMANHRTGAFLHGGKFLSPLPFLLFHSSIFLSSIFHASAYSIHRNRLINFTNQSL